MLMGALYGLLTEEQKVLFLEKLNAISEEVCVIPQEICKQGIGGVHMKVEINGEEEGIAHTHEHHHDHEEAHEHSHCAEHSMRKLICIAMRTIMNMHIIMKVHRFIIIITMKMNMHMCIITGIMHIQV